MLYLSQRKISQITRMNGDSNLGGKAGALQPRQEPAGMAGLAGLGQLAQQQPAGGSLGEVEDGEHEGVLGQQARGGSRYQKPSKEEHQGSYQPQQSLQNSYEVKINVSSEGKNQLNAEITKIEEEIKDNKEKFFFRLMTAVFLGFCSIAIGIGTNMKYGPGDMSALESLAGKRGLDGIVNNDPLRGINYGYAVAGFVLPIVGTIFSLAMALYSRNEVKKGEKNNRLRDLAKEGFSLPKTIDNSVHPNHVKLKVQVDKIALTPDAVISSSLAVQLAKAHYREMKSLGG